MKKVSLLGLVLGLAILLVFSVGAWALDQDTDTVTATIKLAETVHIDTGNPATVNFADVTEDDIIAGHTTLTDAFTLRVAAITGWVVSSSTHLDAVRDGAPAAISADDLLIETSENSDRYDASYSYEGSNNAGTPEEETLNLRVNLAGLGDCSQNTGIQWTITFTINEN